MVLDINKILEAQKEKIEQKELERFQELGILSGKVDIWYALGDNDAGCYVRKCKHEGQVFFIFNYFVFDSELKDKNSINLEKYLQSNESNLILRNCQRVKNQETIKNLNKIKQAIIVVDSEIPNISSCEFENEVFLRNISNNTFSRCKFTKEVYVDGYACFHSCTFNDDFVSKHAREDIDFINCVFNKSFELATINKLRGINFEGTHFNQKFTMDIREFNDLNFHTPYLIVNLT
ncbi:hypothetical protein ACHJH3_00780 [Campylobacter sp. MOP7]|uniref:hypothetical protein n=1 Tax=Campylobacter canis TaxID=3378588 RepID=UPI00387E9014